MVCLACRTHHVIAGVGKGVLGKEIQELFLGFFNTELSQVVSLEIFLDLGHPVVLGFVSQECRWNSIFNL